MPKTIIYKTLNPADNTTSLRHDDWELQERQPFPAKFKLGAGWWFLDQKERAMEWQMNALSNLGPAFFRASSAWSRTRARS